MDLNKGIIDIVGSRVKLKLLKFIVRDGFEMSASDLARLAGLPVMTVNRVLKEFFAMNLLYVNRVGNANVWRANRGSYAFKAATGITKELMSVREPVETIKDIITDRFSIKGVKRAVLFGSVAYGTSREESDIDLFVLTEDKSSKIRAEKAAEEAGKRISELFGNPLVAYVLTREEYAAGRDKPLIKQIDKGVKII